MFPFNLSRTESKPGRERLCFFFNLNRTEPETGSERFCFLWTGTEPNPKPKANGYVSFEPEPNRIQNGKRTVVSRDPESNRIENRKRVAMFPLNLNRTESKTRSKQLCFLWTELSRPEIFATVLTMNRNETENKYNGNQRVEKRFSVFF